jgi:hypothetical protein
MNPLNLFKFLEKQKGKPIPVRLKLIHGLPLTSEELNIKGDLDLSDTSITSLPQGLKVEGYLILDRTPIISLPKNLQVIDISLNNCIKITSLPKGLQVKGYLALENTSISSLPSDLKLEGSLWIKGTPLAEKSDREIRAMLKKFLSKTGYIKGRIHRV